MSYKDDLKFISEQYNKMKPDKKRAFMEIVKALMESENYEIKNQKAGKTS